MGKITDKWKLKAGVHTLENTLYPIKGMRGRRPTTSGGKNLKRERTKGRKSPDKRKIGSKRVKQRGRGRRIKAKWFLTYFMGRGGEI
jgi:hypothetical protein